MAYKFKFPRKAKGLDQGPVCPVASLLGPEALCKTGGGRHTYLTSYGVSVAPMPSSLLPMKGREGTRILSKDLKAAGERTVP